MLAIVRFGRSPRDLLPTERRGSMIESTGPSPRCLSSHNTCYLGCRRSHDRLGEGYIEFEVDPSEQGAPDVTESRARGPERHGLGSSLRLDPKFYPR